MKKLSFIFFLMIIFSNDILYAWSCNQKCPSGWFSGRAECLTYKRGCKAKKDISNKAEIIKNDVNRAAKNAREAVQRKAKRAREAVQRKAKNAREAVQRKAKRARERAQEETKKKAKAIVKKQKVIERDVIKTRESIRRYSTEKTEAIKKKYDVVMQDVDEGYIYQKQKSGQRIKHYQEVLKNTEYNPMKNEILKKAAEKVKEATVGNGKRGYLKFKNSYDELRRETNSYIDKKTRTIDKKYGISENVPIVEGIQNGVQYIDEKSTAFDRKYDVRKTADLAVNNPLKFVEKSAKIFQDEYGEDYEPRKDFGNGLAMENDIDVKTAKNIAIFINGYRDCCTSDSNVIISYVHNNGFKVYLSPWNTFYPISGSYSENQVSKGPLDREGTRRFGRELNNFLQSLNESQNVYFFAHSFGAHSLLYYLSEKNIGVERKPIKAKIKLVAIFDAVNMGGLRAQSGLKIPEYVEIFYNRWQENFALLDVPFDAFLGDRLVPCRGSRVVNTRTNILEPCNQKSRKYVREIDGKVSLTNCGRLELCDGKSNILEPLGVGGVLGSTGKKDFKMNHSVMPSDPLIQYELNTIIKHLANLK